MEKMEGGKGAVCMRGDTEFIASWLIRKLLEEGYSVHTTVRVDPDNKRDISLLTTLPGAAEKLTIFNADLSEPESFDAAEVSVIFTCIDDAGSKFTLLLPIDINSCSFLAKFG